MCETKKHWNKNTTELSLASRTVRLYKLSPKLWNIFISFTQIKKKVLASPFSIKIVLFIESFNLYFENGLMNVSKDGAICTTPYLAVESCCFSVRPSSSISKRWAAKNTHQIMVRIMVNHGQNYCQLWSELMSIMVNYVGK